MEDESAVSFLDPVVMPGIDRRVPKNTSISYGGTTHIGNDKESEANAKIRELFELQLEKNDDVKTRELQSAPMETDKFETNNDVEET